VNHPLSFFATKVDLSPYKNTAQKINIAKLEPVALTTRLLTAYDDSSFADGYRSLNPEIKSVSMTQDFYPGSITVSEMLADQSKISFPLFCVKILARFKADVLETKLYETLLTSSKKYTSTGAGKVVDDLKNVTLNLDIAGASEILSQFIATTQISTAGIPKAYACISSPLGSSKIADAYIALKDTYFKTGTEYAGSMNYSTYVRGAYIPNRITVMFSNHPTFKDDVAIILGGDAYGIGNPTISEDGLYVRDPLAVSPIASHYDVSARNVISIGVFRPEHIATYTGF
jgi:hypothetical protein